MTTATYVYSTTLTVIACHCGIPFAIPDDLYRSRRADGKEFYCPQGHSCSYRETENARLARQLRNSQDRAANLLAERDQAEASRRAWKGHVTRLRNRVIEGDCPLCGQHLRDLARHIGRIHPEAKAELTEAEAGS